MVKSLFATVVALFVVVGCVSVAPTVSTPPSNAASAAPSLGVTTPAPVTPAATANATATPTVAPTSVPTATQTEAPTETPVATATTTVEPTTLPSETPSATATPGGEPSTRDLIYDDDFSDPASGWSTLDEDFATITYDTGMLAFRFNQDQAWAYTVRDIAGAHATLLPVAYFSPASDGFFGMLCGNSVGGQMYGAVVGTDGTLAFVVIENTTVNVLKRHDDLDLDVTIAGSNPMALECAVDGLGGLSMVVCLSRT